jgi:hypothetical protein
MNGSNDLARSIEQAAGRTVEPPAYSATPRNVAIWIDRQTAVLQAFWSGSPESIDAAQTGGSARAMSGGWWAERIEARQIGPPQQYLDAILAHLAPGDEVLILGPDERKRDLCQRIDASGGRCGHIVGVCHASDLTSADVVVPVTHAIHSTGTVAERREQRSVPGKLAGSREMETL